MRNQIDFGGVILEIFFNKRVPFFGFSLRTDRTKFVSLHAKREQPTESWISRSTKISKTSFSLFTVFEQLLR